MIKSINKKIYIILSLQISSVSLLFANTTSYVEIEPGKIITAERINERADRTMEKKGDGELIILNASNPASSLNGNSGSTSSSSDTFLVKITKGSITSKHKNSLGNNVTLNGGKWNLDTGTASDLSSKFLSLSADSSMDVKGLDHTLPSISGDNSSSLSILNSGESVASVDISTINDLKKLSIGKSGQYSLNVSGNASNIDEIDINTNGKMTVTDQTQLKQDGAIGLFGGEFSTTSSATISSTVKVSSTNGLMTPSDDLELNGAIKVELGTLNFNPPSDKKVILNQSSDSSLNGYLSIVSGELDIQSNNGFPKDTSSSLSFRIGSQATTRFSTDATVKEFNFF